MKSMLVKTLLNFQVATVNSQIEIYNYDQQTSVDISLSMYYIILTH